MQLRVMATNGDVGDRFSRNLAENFAARHLVSVGSSRVEVH